MNKAKNLLNFSSNSSKTSTSTKVLSSNSKELFRIKVITRLRCCS